VGGGVNWKDHHANESGKALDHDLVREVMDEYAKNMGFELEGLPRYGLMKVAMYAAQAARAQALGFDPDLLRMSDGEADEQMLQLAEAAALAGKPVWFFGAGSS
jgi:hypothetical protein